MMFERVRADDLIKWPLMHGAALSREQVLAVRRDGLIAGSQQNSYAYDSELEKTKSVFLSTASFRFSYGFGCGFLIDPCVLHGKMASFSDLDVGAAYDCVRITLSSGPGAYCGNPVKEPAILARIIDTEGTFDADDADESDGEMAMRVIRTDAFKKYYRSFYFMTEIEFFETIETTALANGYTLFDYFNRNNNWPLHEEISNPGNVRPEYILGYWDGRWTEWTRASDPEVQARVDEWIRVRMLL
jgi:hypothetical protein